MGRAGRWWFTPEILATGEAEISVQGQLGKIVLKTLS
jgi:hypothetical protein